MVWTKVIAANELPPGSRKVVKPNQQPILLLNVDGTLYAVSNQCPHLKLPMKTGKLKDGAIICPFHRSAFDLCSGEMTDWTPFPPVVGPLMGKVSAAKPLPIFSIRLENENIEVDLP